MLQSHYVAVWHSEEILCPTCGNVVAKKATSNQPSISMAARRDGTLLRWERTLIEPQPRWVFQVACECGRVFPLIPGSNCTTSLEPRPIDAVSTVTLVEADL